MAIAYDCALRLEPFSKGIEQSVAQIFVSLLIIILIDIQLITYITIDGGF